MIIVSAAYFDCKDNDTLIKKGKFESGIGDNRAHNCSIVLHYPDKAHENKQEGKYVGFVTTPSGKGNLSSARSWMLN